MSYLQDFVGNRDVRRELEMYCDAVCNPQPYSALQAALPKGILLWGGTGVGKTMLANTLLKVFDRTNYVVSCGNDMQEYLANITEAFDSAAETAPAAILIEGIDKLLEADCNHVCTVLEKCFDSLDGQEVIVVATATGIADMPEALLSPDRFGPGFELDVPDRKASDAYVKSRLAMPEFDTAINKEDIAQMMRFSSVATMNAVFRQAALYAGLEKKTVISQSHLIRAFLLLEYKCLYEDKVEVKPDSYDEEEYSRISYHEAGHLVALELLIKNSVAFAHVYPDKLGVVRPSEYMLTPEQNMIFTLGGTAATELKFGADFGGSAEDLKTALDTIQPVVTEDVILGSKGISYFGEQTSSLHRFQQEQTIQHELDSYLSKTKQMLAKHWDMVEAAAAELRCKHVLLPSDIRRIMGQTHSDT